MISKGNQCVLLRVVLEIKKEDLQYRSRLVAGVHVADSGMSKTYMLVDKL